MKQINKERRGEVLEDIGEYLIQSILDRVGSGKTAVKGGSYKKSLSKEYKELKKQISGSSIANMELSGDMLDSLNYEIDENNMSIEIGIFDPEQAKKADNHNKFSPESKKTKLPRRQFIPRKNERFDENIMKEVYKIARENAGQD